MIPLLIHWTSQVKHTQQLEAKQEKCTISLAGKWKREEKNKEMGKDHRCQTGKSVLLTDLVVDHDKTETRIKNLAMQNSIHKDLENDRGHIIDHERQQIDK